MAGRLLTSQLCVITESRGAGRLFRRLLHTKLVPKCQGLSTTAARLGRKPGEEVEEDPGPLKFTGSKGAQWKVAQTMNLNKNRPMRKIIPVSLTITAFLLYFCVFRKETWLDEELDKNLYQRMPGLLSSVEEEDEDTTTNNVTPST